MTQKINYNNSIIALWDAFNECNKNKGIKMFFFLLLHVKFLIVWQLSSFFFYEENSIQKTLHTMKSCSFKERKLIFLADVMPPRHFDSK